MPTAPAPIHPVELNQAIDKMLRCQDETFRIVRRMSVRLRQEPLGPEIQQAFGGLVKLLAEQSDHTAVLARAVHDQPHAGKAKPIAEVPRDSPSMQRLAKLADSLAAA